MILEFWMIVIKVTIVSCDSLSETAYFMLKIYPFNNVGNKRKNLKYSM